MTDTLSRNDAGNWLLAAPIQPIAVPLWYGCEKPGPHEGAIAIRDGLPTRWQNPRFAHLAKRLLPAETIEVPGVGNAEDKLHRQDLTFLDSIDATNARLADLVEAAIRAGHLPLSIGGDHAMAMGTIAGAARCVDRLGVIWMDTHPDLNTPGTSPSGHIHGMPLAVALGDAVECLPRASKLASKVPMVRHSDVCLIGIRDIDLGEEEIITRNGMFAHTTDDWYDEGVRAGLQQAIDHLLAQGVDAIHLSFDLDVLDPVDMTATGTQYVGGLTVRDASQALRFLGESDAPIHSIDVVEYNPRMDQLGTGFETALHLTATALGQRMLTRG